MSHKCPKCHKYGTFEPVECRDCAGVGDDWRGDSDNCPICNGDGIDPDEMECVACGYIGPTA